MTKLLAYVFSHWSRADVALDAYAVAQQAFHASLRAKPPAGYRGSFSSRLSGAPWAAEGLVSFEDWYLLDGFAALESLNVAAVDRLRSEVHTRAASGAAGGTAGVYGLRAGQLLERPHYAYWFSKPSGTSYAELLAALSPVLSSAESALWMRQMTLGPAREFCLHANVELQLPLVDALAVRLEPIWP